MLGTRRARAAIGASTAAGMLLSLTALAPSPVQADVTSVQGRAAGIEGLIAVTSADPQDEPLNLTVEPSPEVVLPFNGGERVGHITSYDAFQGLEADALRAFVEGEVGSAGGASARGVAEGLAVLDRIVVGSVVGRCRADQLDRIPSSRFEDVVIDGQEFDGELDPNTEVAVPGFGMVVLNKQEILHGDILRVTGMEILMQGYELENGATVDAVIAVGVAECGFVAEADLRDDDATDAGGIAAPPVAVPVEGDPDFTG